MMKTNPGAHPVAFQEIASKFEKDVANADNTRAVALSGLQRARAAKANHAEREQGRLAAKLGEDHPEVVRLKAEVAASRRLGRQLGAEIDRTVIARPVADEASWTLYGFVRDTKSQGQPNLTVALFDRAGEWVRPLGYACTDKSGYFKLSYQQSSEKGTETMAVAVNISREVVIWVSDQKENVLYRDKRPLSFALGEIQYREITLNGECDRCQPPSDRSSNEPPSSTKPSAKSKSRKTQAP